MTFNRFQFGEYDLFTVQVLRRTYRTFNYLLCRGGEAVLIDAGEAGPLMKVLEDHKLHLTAILITHNHPDHVGGCRALQDRFGVQSTSPGVESGERILLGTSCRSIATPGHLSICKSYYFPELGLVFTGDTLINGGCGRMMGGTPEQFFQSLVDLGSLPENTRIFGGHDYLVENMEFALMVEPGNPAMQARLERYRTDPVSAVLTSLKEEKKTNPFLCLETPDQFAELRRWKDTY